MERERNDGRWRQFVLLPLQTADDNCRDHLNSSRGVDVKTIAVLLTTAVTLTLQEYVFASHNTAWIESLLTAAGAGDLARAWLGSTASPEVLRLAKLLYWASGSIITYVVLPVLVVLM